MAFPRLQARREAQVNLTPLVDVVFNILIFLILTTTFLSDTGIPLDIPEAGTGEPSSREEAFTVQVAPDGAIRFKGKEVSLADLETGIRDALSQAPGQSLTIFGDAKADYETIIQVMDVARRCDVAGIVLATQEPRPRP
jgi:biopolymer transport protein ExbD